MSNVRSAARLFVKAVTIHYPAVITPATPLTTTNVVLAMDTFVKATIPRCLAVTESATDSTTVSATPAVTTNVKATTKCNPAAFTAPRKRVSIIP